MKEIRFWQVRQDSGNWRVTMHCPSPLDIPVKDISWNSTMRNTQPSTQLRKKHKRPDSQQKCLLFNEAIATPDGRKKVQSQASKYEWLLLQEKSGDKHFLGCVFWEHRHALPNVTWCQNYLVNTVSISTLLHKKRDSETWCNITVRCRRSWKTWDQV